MILPPLNLAEFIPTYNRPTLYDFPLSGAGVQHHFTTTAAIVAVVYCFGALELAYRIHKSEHGLFR